VRYIQKKYLKTQKTHL